MAVTVRGLNELRTKLQSIPERLEAASLKGTRAAGELLVVETKRLLSLRSHPRGTPTPSPPGAPPARISGDLRASVRMTGTPVTVSVGVARVEVTSDLDYSYVQEFGGRVGRGSILPRRPYVKSALDNVTIAMIAIVAEAWMEAILE